MTICKKCGAHIKHVYDFNGEQYGGDCVQVVAGLKTWEMRTAGTDIDSYLERKAARVAQMKLREEKKTARIEKYTAENGWMIDFLEQKENSFAHSLANTLKMKSYASLSDKQKESIQWFYTAPYANLQKGLAIVEYLAATEGMEPHEIREAQECAASYGTLAELKAILKENGVKGYSKLGREALEELAAPFIKVI